MCLSCVFLQNARRKLVSISPPSWLFVAKLLRTLLSRSLVNVQKPYTGPKSWIWSNICETQWWLGFTSRGWIWVQGPDEWRWFCKVENNTYRHVSLKILFKQCFGTWKVSSSNGSPEQYLEGRSELQKIVHIIWVHAHSRLFTWFCRWISLFHLPFFHRSEPLRLSSGLPFSPNEWNLQNEQILSIKIIYWEEMAHYSRAIHEDERFELVCWKGTTRRIPNLVWKASDPWRHLELNKQNRQ